MIIGITGGIACGKSLITDYLLSHGYYVLDADKISHEALEKGSPVFKEILSHFHFKEEIDHKELSKVIFHNSKERKYLESIIHPYVKEKILAHLEPLTFIDVPLLFETDFYLLCDKIITVKADRNIQIKRLMERDHMSYQEAVHRISLQMPIIEKEKRSDYIIDNSGTIEHTYQQLNTILGEIKHAIS